MRTRCVDMKHAKKMEDGWMCGVCVQETLLKLNGG